MDASLLALGGDRFGFHPMVLINGNPVIGAGTKIGVLSEIYDKGGIVRIGANCDIASMVVVNCADSHRKTIGLSDEVELLPIEIGDNVFIGTHSAILGGCKIGHHSVIGAGVILRKHTIVLSHSVVKAHPRQSFNWVETWQDSHRMKAKH